MLFMKSYCLLLFLWVSFISCNKKWQHKHSIICLLSCSCDLLTSATPSLCHLFSLPQNPHSFNDFSYGSHHISDNTVTYFFAYFDPVFPRWNNQNCSVQLMHICHEVIQGITKPCFLMYFFPKILLFWPSVKTQIMIPESIQRCQSSIFPKNFYLNVLTIQYAHISYMHTKLLNKTLNSSDICTDCSIITLMFMKWRPVITCCGHMNWCIFLPLSPKAWK